MPMLKRKPRCIYRLIRLREETAKKLKKLMDLTGEGSLDGPVGKMIRLTEVHRSGLAEAGWENHPIR